MSTSFLNNRYVIALVHGEITARVRCSFCKNSQSCNLDDRYTTIPHTRLTYFCNIVAIYAIVVSKKKNGNKNTDVIPGI